ncbi:MAG: CxxxxCH/CxxCH domain-containing protein [Oscillospiraceae bacterium]
MPLLPKAPRRCSEVYCHSGQAQC